MIRTILILSLSPFLAGCNIQDLTNPGAASREAYEHRQSLLIQPDTPTPKPIVVPVHVEPTKPVCIVTYRINRCDENGNTVDWYYL